MVEPERPQTARACACHTEQVRLHTRKHSPALMLPPPPPPPHPPTRTHTHFLTYARMHTHVTCTLPVLSTLQLFLLKYVDKFLCYLPEACVSRSSDFFPVFWSCPCILDPRVARIASMMTFNRNISSLEALQ